MQNENQIRVLNLNSNRENEGKLVSLAKPINYIPKFHKEEVNQKTIKESNI